MQIVQIFDESAHTQIEQFGHLSEGAAVVHLAARVNHSLGLLLLHDGGERGVLGRQYARIVVRACRQARSGRECGGAGAERGASQRWSAQWPRQSTSRRFIGFTLSFGRLRQQVFGERH